MGNREQLLEAAKRCLYEKGYSRTTARDIATAANVSLAAIGYHYRSTEALLNTALIEAIKEWGAQLGMAMAADAGPAEGPLERFERIWTRVIESLTRHRALWVASFEIYGQIEHVPEIREFLANATQLARTGLAALFENIDEATIDDTTGRTTGSFYYALMTGVLSQWLIDPEHAPSARDLTDALAAITRSIRPTPGSVPGRGLE